MIGSAGLELASTLVTNIAFILILTLYLFLFDCFNLKEDESISLTFWLPKIIYGGIFLLISVIQDVTEYISYNLEVEKIDNQSFGLIGNYIFTNIQKNLKKSYTYTHTVLTHTHALKGDTDTKTKYLHMHNT